MQESTSSARTEKRAKRVLVAGAIVVSWFVQTTDAFADAAADDRAKARAAYERATAANDLGDYATAARELALADELAPNAVTLSAALESALDADAAAVGMELEARARLRGASGPLEALAKKARERFSGRVGRVKVVCPGQMVCQAKLDGEDIRPGVERFVLAGQHVVFVHWSGGSATRQVDVSAGNLSVVDDYPSASSSSSSRPPIGIFIAGLGLTFVGITATSLLGSETMSRHDEFVGARCDQVGSPRCSQLASEGRSAQLATNVVLGGTVALGIATTALAYMTFGKKNNASGQTSGVTLEPRPGGGFARLVLVIP